MKAYAAYCNDKIKYDELETQLSFTDYIAQTKSFLVKQYIDYRRENRRVKL
jgi:hypothetical protein